MALLVLSGCGGDDGPEPRVNTEDVSPRLERPDKAGEAGTLEHRACDLVAPAEVERAVRRPDSDLRSEPNDSFDLSICQIKAVGRDGAYGGAGAWWTRAGSMLVAFKAKKILRLRVNVAGLGDMGSRRAAVIIAKRAFARLSEPAA